MMRSDQFHFIHLLGSEKNNEHTICYTHSNWCKWRGQMKKRAQYLHFGPYSYVL
jgi:hypothetical protein